MPNKLDGLAKEISGQRIIEGSSWVLLASYDKTQQERDELEKKCFIFQAKFREIIGGQPFLQEHGSK